MAMAGVDADTAAAAAEGTEKPSAATRGSDSRASSSCSSRVGRQAWPEGRGAGGRKGTPQADGGGGAGTAERGRKEARESPLLVLKVGTSSLMVSDSTGQRVQLANVAQLVELISQLKRKDYQVVLISSGAVGMGCIKLGIPKPTNIRTKQAVAAAGQSQLIRMYEDLFGALRLKVAQLLISQNDFMDKEHWSNVKHTIVECLKLGVVPIINENDCTNTEELRFGDNDNLAALTAVQIEADGLFLFTDVDYLYTANPRADPNAKPLRVVKEPWALQVDTRLEGSGLGTGGMATKIIAARTASTAGIPCGLINGQHPGRLHSFLEYGIIPRRSGEASSAAAEIQEKPMPEGTYFMAMPPDQTVGDTRRWILSLPVSGEVHVDDGAARALANHKSLLPIGILKVQSQFTRYECIRLMHRGAEVGRAIVNFTSEELGKIRGVHSSGFEDILGYSVSAEACFRSNVILTTAPETLRGFDVATPLPSASTAGAPAADGQKPGRLRKNSSFS